MMKMSKIVNSKYSAWCTLYNAWPQNKHRYRTSQVKMYGLFLLHLEIIGDFLCSWVRSPPWFVLVHLFLPITGTSSKFLRFPIQLRNQGLGITVRVGNLLFCSFVLALLLKIATVSESLLSLNTKERPWVIRSHCSLQKRLALIQEKIAFLLFRLKKTSDSLKKPKSKFSTLIAVYSRLKCDWFDRYTTNF